MQPAQQDLDEFFMHQALAQAERALDNGEVPIGAVVVAGGRVLGKGFNQVEQLTDATAHAEMIALTAAMDALGGKYLDECTLYVTIEPCVMCAGAMRWAQLGELVYGAGEEKYGYTTLGAPVLHPRTRVRGGILAGECRERMQRFFRDRRAR